MKFELTEIEIKKVEEWKKTLKEIPSDVNGEDLQFEYIFYPTGLGTIKLVRRKDGEEIDLTDYNKW